MNHPKQVNALHRHLFADLETRTYAVLDGASVPALLLLFYEHRPEHVCLYRGELHPELAETAPYLVRLEPGSAFTTLVLEQGWGNHWGIFAGSGEDLATVRRHFRRFLMVKDPEGKQLYFRYYDPRVLRVYLPTCNAEELIYLFGPLDWYALEAEDPSTCLQYRFRNDELLPSETALLGEKRAE